MNKLSLIDTCLFAEQAHKYQMYGNNHYSYHLDNVECEYRFLFDIDYKALCICWCHDLFENTPKTTDDLYSLGFDNDMVEAVILLTKPADSTRINYLRTINDSDNPYAWKVKVADAYSNLTESIKINDAKRVQRYLETLKSLFEKD